MYKHLEFVAAIMFTPLSAIMFTPLHGGTFSELSPVLLRILYKVVSFFLSEKKFAGMHVNV